VITLLTGTPGGGKTAHAVDMILSEFRDRPVYVMGIRDLAVDHEVVPPVNDWTEYKASPEDPDHSQAWFTFPPNSVVVIDEAQTVFRPRPVGSKVPPEVQAFETHRHLGIDFVLITQHPNLLDSNIRRLVGRHRHIRVTALGRHMFEWQETGDPDSTTSRSLAAKTRYALPKHVFSRYRSAEVHTKTKTRLPFFVYLFFGAVLALGFAVYRGYDAITSKVASTPVTLQALNGNASVPTTAGAVPVSKPSTADYLDSSIPRVLGLAHTAPRYDEITKPVDAPFPVGCFVVGAWRGNTERCRCVDQQGNNYETTDAVCRSVVKNGIFKDWEGRQTQDGPQARRVLSPSDMESSRESKHPADPAAAT